MLEGVGTVCVSSAMISETNREAGLADRTSRQLGGPMAAVTSARSCRPDGQPDRAREIDKSNYKSNYCSCGARASCAPPPLCFLQLLKPVGGALPVAHTNTQPLVLLLLHLCDAALALGRRRHCHDHGHCALAGPAALAKSSRVGGGSQNGDDDCETPTTTTAERQNQHQPYLSKRTKRQIYKILRAYLTLPLSLPGSHT